MVVGILFSMTLNAHNGEVAIANSIQGIVVDAKFDDWPPTAVRYPISRVEYGDSLTSDEDMIGSFRVAFDFVNQSLYVAIEVQDDSIVLPTASQARWNNSDGCEIYIDGDHLVSTANSIQHIHYGRHRPLQDGKVVTVASTQSEKTHRYEWRIQ